MINSHHNLTFGLRKLWSSRSGMAAVEFALCLPVLVAVGGVGIEIQNYVSVNHRLSQAALALADNMSRVGVASGLSRVQVREADVNDGFIGIKLQTPGLDLTTNGRIILTSLEQNASGGQWVHWQRCIGLKNVASSYAGQGTGATGTAFAGFGPSTARITAPANSAVIHVEIFYDYKPVFFKTKFTGDTVRYEASYLVRDDRDFSGAGIFNPSPAATVASCNILST
jgi:hypothetical protein